MKKFIIAILATLTIGCGTCQEQVAFSRGITTTALEGIAPFAGMVMSPEEAKRWVEVARLLNKAAHDQWLETCPKDEQPETPARAAAPRCPVVGK